VRGNTRELEICAAVGVAEGRSGEALRAVVEVAWVAITARRWERSSDGAIDPEAVLGEARRIGFAD
jgi:hypothetical protein